MITQLRRMGRHLNLFITAHALHYDGPFPVDQRRPALKCCCCVFPTLSPYCERCKHPFSGSIFHAGAYQEMRWRYSRPCMLAVSQHCYILSVSRWNGMGKAKEGWELLRERERERRGEKEKKKREIARISLLIDVAEDSFCLQRDWPLYFIAGNLRRGLAANRFFSSLRILVGSCITCAPVGAHCPPETEQTPEMWYFGQCSDACRSLLWLPRRGRSLSDPPVIIKRWVLKKSSGVTSQKKP